MTQPKNPIVDPREADRKERIAMTLASTALYSALLREHPKIIRHLQSLPMAQKLEAEGDNHA